MGQGGHGVMGLGSKRKEAMETGLTGVFWAGSKLANKWLVGGGRSIQGAMGYACTQQKKRVGKVRK